MGERDAVRPCMLVRGHLKAEVSFVENRFSGSTISAALRVKQRITTPAFHLLLQVVPFLPVCLVLVALVFAGVAFAHPSEILGTLRSDPATPAPGVPFTLELSLEDTDEVPTESARVQAEIYRKDASQDFAAIRTDFKVTGTPGTYRTTLRLPEAGPWTVRLRERTFTHEDAAVEVEFGVRPARNPTAWEFIFAPPSPPTLGTWLLWVVGVPLLAGAVVTASVFGRSGKTRPV
jgi:hypothetical protein